MKISRSFSRKIQVSQFEPVQFFCEVEGEVDETLPDKELIEEMETSSKMLNEFCVNEVEKSIASYKPLLEKNMCARCGGIGGKLNKEKLCEQCAKENDIQIREYRDQRVERKLKDSSK